MKRLFAVLVVLGLAGAAWADQQANDPTTPIAATDTGGTVTLSSTVDYLHFTNDGPGEVIVRAFVTCDTIAGIVTTNTKARLLKAGEGWGLSFSAKDLASSCTPPAAGAGYIGFAYITKAGITASLRWFGK